MTDRSDTRPGGPRSHPETASARPGPEATADELVADIRATRVELGDTVEALSHKFDVRAQAQNTLDDAKHRATTQAQALQARGLELYGQAKDAATDRDGNLTPQARAIAIKVAAGVAATLVLRTVVRTVRR